MKQNHMRQLDGLRALAVLAVMAFHWAPAWPALSGAMGVPLFFVLSGFLITGILLRLKRDIADGEHTVGTALRRFYWRRTLRIFPLFYFVLGLGCLLSLPCFKESITWHAAYLSNVYFVVSDGFAGSTSHFWSLAVEEQFYLVWPLLVFFVPLGRLPGLFGGCIMFAWIYRASCAWGGAGFMYSTILLPATLDYLALGALLAIMHADEKLLDRFSILLDWRVTTFCFAVMVTRAFSGYPYHVYQLVMGVAFLGLVHRAAVGVSGPVGRVLDNAALRYIGRISYGLYVYHLPVAAAFGFDHELGWGMCAVKIAITFAVAVPSYHFFEKPISDLKDRSRNQGDKDGRFDRKFLGVGA